MGLKRAGAENLKINKAGPGLKGYGRAGPKNFGPCMALLIIPLEWLKL